MVCVLLIREKANLLAETKIVEEKHAAHSDYLEQVKVVVKLIVEGENGRIVRLSYVSRNKEVINKRNTLKTKFKIKSKKLKNNITAKRS